MNSMVNYLLESGISLSLLVMVYVLFLRRETFFKLNRLFLLGSLFFSIVLPLIKIRILEPQPVMLSEITVTPYRNLLEAVTVYGKDITVTVEQAVLSVNLLIWVYFIGLGFFLARFLYRLLQVWHIIRKHPAQYHNGIKLVIYDNEGSPFSFLDYVFVDRNQIETEGFGRMLAHETEHIRQGHSFDVLLLEILTVFQWFNPFVWMLRSAIRENHEYLADRAVLASGVSKGYYKKLLLNQFAGGQLVITNNFNYSLIKKRIKMMSKIKSSKAATVKIIAGLLTAIALTVAFACDQKELEEHTVINDYDNLSISFLDESSLKIEGVESDLERLKGLMADSREFGIETDDDGNLIIIKKSDVPKILDNSEQIFFIVEKMPEFPGGELALRQHIANNIKYPVEAQEKGIQGRVYVTFVVDKEGNVANTRIARGVHPSLDMEALRVVNNLPAWVPGEQREKPVNVSYTVPINFALQ